MISVRIHDTCINRRVWPRFRCVGAMYDFKSLIRSRAHVLAIGRYIQELISRWDNERERFNDDIVHVEASAYAHWTDFLSMLLYATAN